MGPQNVFVRRVALLIAGTGGAQAIALLVAPLLTRLYTPDDFGVLAVFAGLLAIPTLVASLRYELAIPIAEHDDEAAHVVVLCLAIVVAMALVIGVALWLWGGDIVSLLNVDLHSGFLWLIPAGVLLTGFYDVFTYWSIRTKEFRAIAHTKWTQAMVMVSIQLAGYTWGAVALVLGQVFGQGVGGARLAYAAVKRHDFRTVRLKDVRTAARRYRRFPLYSTWSALMNTASAQLPALAFAGLFGAAAAGLYLLTYRVLVTPSSLVGNAIGNVFFAHASDARQDGGLGVLVASVYKRLVQLALGPMLIVMAAGPTLFEWLFGPDWRLGGELARWMAPWILLSFVFSPLSSLFDVLEKQNIEAGLQSALLAMRVAAIVIGAASGDIVFTVALFSILSALVYLVGLVVVIRLSNNPFSSFVVPLLSSLGAGVVMMTPVFIANLYSAGTVSLLIAGGVSAVMLGFHYKRMYDETKGVERAA